MVQFSDESKFNLFGSDGKRFVRHKNGEYLSPQNCEIWRGECNGVGDDFFCWSRTHCSFSQ